MAKRIRIIGESSTRRSFVEFSELLKYLKQTYNSDEKPINFVESTGIVTVQSQQAYAQLLASSSSRVLDISLNNCIGSKRIHHPTKAQNPEKQSKFSTPSNNESSNPNFICVPRTMRSLSLINLYANITSSIKNKLFSKTSRAICVDNSIIITGGRLDPCQVLEINTLTQEVRKISSLNTGRYWHAMTLVDGKPAVIGGVQGEKEEKTAISSVEVFNNGSWHKTKSLNYTRANSSCCWIGKTTFVLWGHWYYKGIKLRKGLEKWNGSKWQIIQIMARGVFNPALIAIDQQNLLILGGLKDNETETKRVSLIDIKKKNIKKLKDLPNNDYFTYGQSQKLGNEIILYGNLHKLTSYQLILP